MFSSAGFGWHFDPLISRKETNTMKRAISRVLAILLAGLLLCGVMAFAASAATDITAAFTDPAFRAAVQALIGKTQILDTDVEWRTALVVDSMGIQSLAGLEYFRDLEFLDCSYNQITALPALPSGLDQLWCWDNQLSALPAPLPTGLRELICNKNKLAVLPALPSGLVQLDCSDNRLTALPALPPGLANISCQENQLTSLPALPASLESLWCWDNQLSALPALPTGLYQLDCDNNRLSALPALPPSLKILFCGGNQLSALPTLPLGLEKLTCGHNQLTSLDVTGLQLEILWCNHNKMASTSDVKGFTGTWGGMFLFDPQNSPTPPTPPKEYFKLWGKTTTWEKTPLNWILLILCFGWIWMAF